MFKIWWLNYELIVKWECNLLLFLLYFQFSKIFKLILKDLREKKCIFFGCTGNQTQGLMYAR